MTHYLLIESRDPFEFQGVPEFFRLASDLTKRGDQVTLFLVQNAVMTTRAGVLDNPLEDLASDRVEILADAFSLRERGIDAAERIAGVRPSSVEELVERMMSDHPTKVLWH